MQSLLAVAAIHQARSDNHERSCVHSEGDMHNSEGVDIKVAYAVAPKKSSDLRFDTDSVAIKIDNCCTRTMTCSKADFVTGTLVPIKEKQVKGYGGTLTDITHQGTIKWRIADDEGNPREIIIPNSFYVPGLSIRLLSPQHWAQQARDNFPISRGTWCATFEDSVVLQWNQRSHTRTLQLDTSSTNVATVWTVPGYTKYCTFCVQSEKEGMNTDEIMALDSTIAAMINDDDPIPLESTELPITEMGDPEIMVDPS
jgi:hypothetical protein